MASTDSTGYHPRSIIREQFSSSGQLMAFSSGCELDMDDGSVLRISTGASATIQGSLLLNNSQAVITTTGGTITNRGVSILQPGATSDATYTLASPVAGAYKKIIVTGGSSHEVKILMASSVTVLGVIGSLSTFHSITLSSNPHCSTTLPTGCSFVLQSTGTASWRILDISNTSGVALSSGIS